MSPISVELATAYVSLTTSAKGISQSIEGELTPSLTSEGEKAGEASSKAFGGSFTSGLSSVLGAIGIPMGAIGVQAEQAASGLQHAGGSAGGLAGALSSVPGPVLAVGAAALGVTAIAADLGVKFDATTAKISASAGISQSAASTIGQAFLDTAGTTTFSGQQIAAAYAGVAGQLGTINGPALNAHQALTVMQASMNLAEASGTSLSSTTSDVSKTLQAFQLPVSAAGNVTDILYNAANKTGTSVDSLSTSIDKARATMGSAAPPIADMGGFLLDLTQHGETGRAAITTLGSAFTGIISPTAAVTKAQKDMGVTFTDASGKLLPLSQIIGELAPKLAGMSPTAAAATLSTLGFGSASNKLAETIQAGSTAFDIDTLAVSKHGSAADAAAKTTDTFSGAWAKVKSGVEDAATSLGTKLAPMLTTVGLKLASAVQWVSDNWPQISKVFGTVFNIIKPFVTGFVTQVQGIIKILTGIVDFVSDIFHGKWSAAWDAVKTIFDGFVEYIKGKIQPFLALFNAIEPFLAKIWSDIKADVSTALDAVVGFFTGLPNRILTGLGDVVTVIWAPFALAGAWIDTNVITPVVAFFTALPGDIVTGLGDVVTTIWAGLVSAATWVDTNVILPVVSFFTGLPGSIVTALGDIVGTIWAGLVGAATWVDDNVITPVVTFFTGLPGAVASVLSGFIGTVFSGLTGAWSWIESNVYDPIVTGFSGLPGDIAKAISGAIGDLGGIATAIINALIGAINTAINFYDSHRPSILGVSLLPSIPDISPIGGRASGGPVAAYKPYVVGEKGWEIFVPDVAGSVMSNRQSVAALSGGSTRSGSGGGATYNIEINGTGLTEEQLLRVLNKALDREDDQEAQELRAGG